MMRVGEAREIVGKLSFPTKMPGTSYGLPAKACLTGSKLALVPGSICSSCYALRARYSTANVAKSQAKRLASLSAPRWVEAMVFLLLYTHRNPTFRIDNGVKNAKARGISRAQYNEAGFHRWHDSGDLQSVKHLEMICEVSRQTPEIRHWLPTQELTIVRQFLTGKGEIPPNLVIRVSDTMVDGRARRSWPTTSGVISSAPIVKSGHICPAPLQDHRCGTCRACWSPDVPHVSYLQH